MYFIAILPPDSIRREVLAFKQLIAENWGPRHALRSPAHLTLVPPFDWEISKLSDLERVLSEFAALQKPFEVELKDFGAFAPRVVYIKPLPNPAMEALHRALLTELDKRLDYRDARNKRPFHPHMTIAHRDVEESDFEDIWEEFREQQYRRKFEVRAVSLMEMAEGKWVERRRFDLRLTFYTE